MKYKVLKGTELYNLLVDLEKRIKQGRQKADKLAKSIGAEGVYSQKRQGYGEIAAFRFPHDKNPDKELWMQPDRHNTPDAFYPRSGKGKRLRANDELHKKIAELPKITFKEANKIIGFEDQWVGLSNYITYGLEIQKDFALIEVGEGAKYDPLPDMTEITVSEYLKLKKK